MRLLGEETPTIKPKSLLEHSRGIPLQLKQYEQESSLKKLPPHRVFSEGNNRYIEFTFSNGLRVVTDSTEERIRYPMTYEEVKFLKIKKILVDFVSPDGAKRSVNIFQEKFADISDHYLTFRPEHSIIDSSHCSPTIQVKNEKDELTEKLDLHTVTNVPLTADGRSYDGEKFLAIWLHEAGHAQDFVRTHFTQFFLKSEHGYRTKESRWPPSTDPEDERNATTIGLKFLRLLEKKYGKPVGISTQKYVQINQAGLQDKVPHAWSFQRSYSNRDRADHRNPLIEMKQNARKH